MRQRPLVLPKSHRRKQISRMRNPSGCQTIVMLCPGKATYKRGQIISSLTNEATNIMFDVLIFASVSWSAGKLMRSIQMETDGNRPRNETVPWRAGIGLDGHRHGPTVGAKQSQRYGHARPITLHAHSMIVALTVLSMPEPRWAHRGL